MYFDRQGRPLTVKQWARLFEDWGYRLVARTELAGGMVVTTVWLGMVDSTIDGARLFGTAVTAGGSPQEVARYDTLAQAQLGHEQIVDKVSSGQIKIDPCPD